MFLNFSSVLPCTVWDSESPLSVFECCQYLENWVETSVMKSPPPCLARSQDDGDDGDEVDVASGKHDGVELSADADDAVAQLNLQLST